MSAAQARFAVVQPEAADAVSLSDQAYYRLRELIVTLQLEPGSVISERDLIEQLGIGRTPLREALRALARENLVVVHPRRGMFVATVDVGDLAEASEVRAVLETEAARLAAERSTAGDRAETQRLLSELEDATGSRDERALIELDQRIHLHVARCAHNAFLEATLQQYYALSLRIWFLALSRVPELGAAVQEHRELLEAIRDGEPERALEAMRTHIHDFARAVRAVL